MKKYFPAFASLVFLSITWQIWSVAVGNPELVPGVPRLLEALGNWMDTAVFYRSVAVTLLRGSAGMAISLAAAVVTAMLFSRYRTLYELFRPVLVSMRSVPVISFILFALVFMQPENIPLLIAFLTMFPLLSENLTEGIKQLRPGFAAFGKTFRIRRFNYRSQVLYPQIKPYLFSGLASATGFGWRAVIMGEVLAQCATGIGSEMKKAQTFIDLPTLLGWTLVAAGIGYLSDRGVMKAAALRLRVLYRENDRLPDKLPAKDMPEVPRRIQEEILSFRKETFFYQQKSGEITLQPEPFDLAEPVVSAASDDAGGCFAGAPAVVLKKVGFSYAIAPAARRTGPDKLPVLYDFSYMFATGCIYGLSAPSGAGKSTMLQLIAGILRPTSGSITTDRKYGMAFMFQEPELLPDLTARENVRLPLASLVNETVASLEADRCLLLTETDDLAPRFPSELSYGQQQRIALARALAYPSPVVLLDEPFKGVDQALALRIIGRIRERQRLSGQTIIFASHKAGELEALADRILRIG